MERISVAAPCLGIVSVSQDDELEAKGKEFLSPEEFRLLSGLSPATISRYLKSGKLPKVQPGGKRCRVMIPRSALNALTASPAVTPTNAPSEQPDRPSVRPVRSGPRARWKRSQPQGTK